MKILFMLPLLLAPVAGYGQAGLFQQAPIGDIAPIKTFRADAGIGKGFQLAFSTLFFPDRVKNEWPVYGYEISNIKSKLCSDQSVYGETFTVEKAALVRPRRDLSIGAAYLGVPIRPTEGGEITGRMEEICIGIKKFDLARELRIYDVIDLPSGTWRKAWNLYFEEVIPLLIGTLTTDDVSEQDHSMVWTLESPELGTPKVGWKKYDHSLLDGHGRPWDTVWGYVPDGGTREDITYYLAKIGGLAKTGGNSQNKIGSQGRIAISSSWAGEFDMENISDFTLGSRYSIGYLPKKSLQSMESQQSFVDDWFFVTDEPLPRAEADIRIEPFE